MKLFLLTTGMTTEHWYGYHISCDEAVHSKENNEGFDEHDLHFIKQQYDILDRSRQLYRYDIIHS